MENTKKIKNELQAIVNELIYVTEITDDREVISLLNGVFAKLNLLIDKLGG